ncbi:MAG: bifunctional phosphoribosylaminoimidazolecarboxamide formyltransferase/IMP cyclohydrolase, partial [Chloroflexi bacterium]|nr:bifunctional phosphoribosylaminoimidazolecarboxamide formyltransferase/IMP cyclohydrolase [Chloroflexota bacterium]
AFPGTDAVSDALAAGVRVTGVTVHVVDESLDGGPIVLQQAVSIVPSDDDDALLARLHAVEHRLLPRAVALMLAGAAAVEGGRVTIGAARAAELPHRRRALISVSDKTGLADLGRGLAALDFELVSTGGTARALRETGLAVTDVSTVTGSPEMLDGRVKTLHPRIAAGILADRRQADHRAQIVAAGIEPFEVVVVNLYPFEAASRRAGIAADELIEEIDIGGPTLVRAAAKNHANVAVVTDPARYPELLAAMQGGIVPDGTRRSLAVEAFAHTAAYDSTIARVLPAVLEDGSAGSSIDPFPPVLDLRLERVERLRYGENPHQAAALYRRSGTSSASGPFADGVRLLQGKALSYNNILDASAATALARDLRGPAVTIIKHLNPCGAAEADDLGAAWHRALAGDRVSAFGGVVAVRGTVDRSLASDLAAIFLEVVVAASFDPDARDALAAKPNLRLIEDPSIMSSAPPGLELRTAGGGVLLAESDGLAAEDAPASWRTATTRAPSRQELTDLDLAWRVARHVGSNAIVLTRQHAIVGVGAGQMSRVDSCRLAIDKAGSDRAVGAACASDAFFPFPDGVETCLAAGVTAFVQPGGSQRDAEVLAAAERAGATMLLTGRRHFRH